MKGTVKRKETRGKGGRGKKRGKEKRREESGRGKKKKGGSIELLNRNFTKQSMSAESNDKTMGLLFYKSSFILFSNNSIYCILQNY